jgi:hypothetical protein
LLPWEGKIVVIDTKIFVLLFKGTVSQDFLLLVFLMISFPPTTKYCIRTVSNFFVNSRRYSQVKVHHRYQRHRWQICHRYQNCCRYQRHLATNLPPVSATLAANFSTNFASVVDSGGKFATCVNDTGGKFATGGNNVSGKLPPVSTTPAANLPPVSMTPVANNGENIRLQSS